MHPAGYAFCILFNDPRWRYKDSFEHSNDLDANEKKSHVKLRKRTSTCGRQRNKQTKTNKEKLKYRYKKKTQTKEQNIS